jgi:hypothetical protein
LRKSHVFFLFLLLCLAVISGLAVSSLIGISEFSRSTGDLAEITRVLRLTDVSFSHDARYTRNPSQADLFSAFQDYPGSIEHFPSGSVVPAPDFGSLGTRITVKRAVATTGNGQ